MTTILALDLSLTRTGWAARTGPTRTGWVVGSPGPDVGVFVPPKGQDRGLPRLAWIRDRVMEKALGVGADVVVIEGLAFGARGRAMLDLAGLAAVVRLALMEQGIPFADVPPSSLKKFATGAGNADKAAVLAAAIRRLDYAGHDHNESDALWLLQAGRLHYGLPGAVTLPTAQQAAIAAVPWPVL